MKRIKVADSSTFSPDAGGIAKIEVYTEDGKKIMEYERKCIQGDKAGIEYPFLNPLQTAFVEGFAGDNTLVCSPTSSGKSLIAKLFMDRFPGRKVYIAPTKALVREKYYELKRLYGEVDIRVGEAIEDFKPVKANIVVATYDALVLSLRNKAGWTGTIKAAVFDEIHQIFKEDTGWSVDEVLFYLKGRAKLLGLSATIYEPLKLAKYMGATLFIESEWRPTKLIKHEPERLPADRRSKTSKEDAATRTALRLLEYVRKKTSPEDKVIVFTTKRVGWKALELANMLWEYEVVNESTPFDKVVYEKPAGKVAFHNADISSEEREKIEKEFNTGDLNLLFATSTLAYGVNTPADKVIIVVIPLPGNGIYPGALDIIQMEGRAGRFGIKEIGEVFTAISWIKPETFTERFDRDLGKRFEESLSSRKIDPSLLVLIGILHEGQRYEKFLENFRFNLKADDIKRSIGFLIKKGYVKDFKLTDKGMFSVKSNIAPERLEEFLSRYSRTEPMEELEKVFICRPLIKNSFRNAVSFLEQFGLGDEIRFYAHKFIGKDSRDLSEVLLMYVNGELFKHKNINRPPAGLELRTEAMFLLRSLVELKKKKVIQWSDEEILKVVHAIAYGLPPEQSLVGSIPGLGFVKATAVARAMRRALLKTRIGISVEELINLLESCEEFHTYLDEELSLRYGSEKEKARVVSSINTALYKSKDFLLGDEKVLRLWIGFREGTKYMTLPKKEITSRIR